MTFTTAGRKIAGYMILFAAAFTGWAWIASKPEQEQSIWWLTVAFGIAFCIAMDAHAKARDLQRRLERLEQKL